MDFDLTLNHIFNRKAMGIKPGLKKDVVPFHKSKTKLYIFIHCITDMANMGHKISIRRTIKKKIAFPCLVLLSKKREKIYTLPKRKHLIFNRRNVIHGP